jgi:predicted porin
VTIYGRLNTGVEHVHLPGSGNVARLSNYRSVLGFRGEEDLGGGLKALWQIEGGITLDTGGGAIANRDTRLGLAGPWGTLFMGVWTLPYTSATSSFDPFYPTTAGYMAIMGNGSAPNTNNIQDTSSFDRRQGNQIQYWSPRLAGLSARLAYGVNEETVAATGAKPWLASGSVTYESGNLVLTAAHERHAEYQTASTTDTAMKVGAAYQWGAARLAAAYERLKYGTSTGDLKRNAWYVSGTYRIGAGTLKAGYSRAGNGKGNSTETIGFFRSGADTGSSQLTVGYDHDLSKRTSLQAYYSRINNDAQAIYDFAINELGVGPGQRPSVLAIGLRHAF